MYALVSLWQLSEDPPEGLPEPLIQRAREAPGFVVDYWTHEPGNGKVFGFLVLDSADHAHALCAAIERDAEIGDHSGAHLEMARVQRIVIQADASATETTA